MQNVSRITFAILALFTCIVEAPAQTAAPYQEALRPQFHFTAEKNWLNDPNGMLYYDGVYHLFFQYNPYGRESAHKSWGHATSADMIRWTQVDTALFPDKFGDMWSGSGVVDEANTSGFQSGSAKPLVLIYTAAGGTNKESAGRDFTQCIAYSADAGKTWTKYANNPVLKHIRGGNRDPKVIWHAPTKRWIMALYLDDSDFAFCSSADLKSWTQIQTLTVPGCSECPDFFEMPIENEPGKTAWVWTSANSKYLVGDFDGKQFTPQPNNTPLENEFSRTFYAAQTFSNTPDGRRIQIPWFRDGQYPGMPFNQQLGFPANLTLHRTPSGLRLHRMPIAEIKSLHDTTVTKLEDLHGDLLDINAVLDVGTSKQLGLRIRGQSITFDATKNTLTCLNATAPLTPINGQITLRILVDRTSIEIFANDGVASLSNCFVPDKATVDASKFFSDDASAKLASCEAYTLKSAWKDSR